MTLYKLTFRYYSATLTCFQTNKITIPNTIVRDKFTTMSIQTNIYLPMKKQIQQRTFTSLLTSIKTLVISQTKTSSEEPPLLTRRATTLMLTQTWAISSSSLSNLSKAATYPLTSIFVAPTPQVFLAVSTTAPMWKFRSSLCPRGKRICFNLNQTLGAYMTIFRTLDFWVSMIRKITFRTLSTI